MHNSVAEVDICDWVVVVGSVVVRDEQVDVEASEVDLTHSKAFSSKPVSVQQLVRVAIQSEFMESDILDFHLGEDCSPSANYPIVKVVRVRKLACN